MTASIATDFPEPDSPTIASTSPASTDSDTPSTARNGPWRGGEVDGEVADLEEGHWFFRLESLYWQAGDQGWPSRPPTVPTGLKPIDGPTGPKPAY